MHIPLLTHDALSFVKPVSLIERVGKIILFHFYLFIMIHSHLVSNLPVICILWKLLICTKKKFKFMTQMILGTGHLLRSLQNPLLIEVVFILNNCITCIQNLCFFCQMVNEIKRIILIRLNNKYTLKWILCLVVC